MFKVEHLYKHVQGSVKVEWNLGKRCNYDCTYCPAEIHDNTSKHTDIKIFIMYHAYSNNVKHYKLFLVICFNIHKMRCLGDFCTTEATGG